MSKRIVNTRERKNKGVREWYQRNSDSFNELRRNRYATDPERRKKAVERAKQYREQGPVAPSREKYRLIGGLSIRVFSSGEVARLLNRSPQTLRLWEGKGWIPPADDTFKHRFYTDKQVYLLRTLARYLDKNLDASDTWLKEASLEMVIEAIASQWE